MPSTCHHRQLPSRFPHVLCSHCALHCAMCFTHTFQYAMCNVHCAMSSAHTVQCAMYNVQWGPLTLCNVQREAVREKSWGSIGGNSKAATTHASDPLMYSLKLCKGLGAFRFPILDVIRDVQSGAGRGKKAPKSTDPSNQHYDVLIKDNITFSHFKKVLPLRRQSKTICTQSQMKRLSYSFLLVMKRGMKS